MRTVWRRETLPTTREENGYSCRSNSIAVHGKRLAAPRRADASMCRSAIDRATPGQKTVPASPSRILPA